MLYQRAELKKNYIKKVNDTSVRIKKQFIETYNQFLNKSLSSNLIQAKELTLQLKNKFLQDLNLEIVNQVKTNISNNYNNYLHFLRTSINNSIHLIDKPKNVILTLNKKDLSNLKSELSSIKDLFKNKIELTSTEEEFIGGFKAMIREKKITYNYTIDNLLAKNLIMIEQQLSKIFSEDEIEKLQMNFEKDIKTKKQEIEEFLKKYDQL